MIVCALAGVDCLLGLDWLHAMGAQVNFADMTMELGHQRVVYLRSIPLELFSMVRVHMILPVDIEPQAHRVKCVANTDWIHRHS